MKYVPPHNGDTEDPDRPYVDADPGNGIEGSYPAAKGIEHPQREIVNAIAAAGLVPVENDLTQLAQVLALLRTSLTPAGAELDWPLSASIPDGWYEEDGSILNRADVPNLWARIDASGEAVSDAAWLGGDFGKFSTGDGATTLRLPDFRGYSSRAWDHGRGIDTGRALGSVQEDALQNIIGEFRFGADRSPLTLATSAHSGAFKKGDVSDQRQVNAGTGDFTSGGVIFDASLVARTADETRNKSIARMRIIFGGA